MKEIIRRELELKTYTRKWVPHELSEDQKKRRVNQQGTLPDMLRSIPEHNIEGIATGGKSWSICTTCADSMLAVSAAEVVPRTKQNLYTSKTMVTIFFTSTRLVVLNSSSKG
jgi:hypothetical protein